jgi:luciferase family oxidoreductase group 1
MDHHLPPLPTADSPARALPLSVLDLSPVAAGQSSADALAATVAVARHAERLGYGRLWVAEHHNAAGLASASPEVLLPNHAPLRIAEAFRLLEALHPGRIDLGLGRAPGTDQLTALALRRSREALGGDDYPQLLAELLAFDDGSFPDDHPFRAIAPTPADVPLPPIFLLGSSLFSAQLAAQAGLGLGFAAHIGGDTAVPAMRTYRRDFTPSDRYPAPHAILTIGVVVGETEREVAELSHLADLSILRIVRGERGPRPGRAEALAYELTDADRAMIRRMPGKRIVGGPGEVAAEVRAFAAETGADEVMLMTIVPDLDVRLRTLELMAEHLGTGAAAVQLGLAGARAGELAGVA